MSKKVEALYEIFQENGAQVLNDSEEYTEANKISLDAMYNLRTSLTPEQTRLLNIYDDSITMLYGVLLKAYYIKGYEDALEK